ncbi:unnamed protein product [Pleuronectes platessa]|uniref:Uncharacterized protein n=1 Tax=Pleuronectes platessa TaxID=8262 RepID=A0A9N7Z227_PLEPL|nr:unnamed protein product [Pleuronectes platessa]
MRGKSPTSSDHLPPVSGSVRADLSFGGRVIKAPQSKQGVENGLLSFYYCLLIQLLIPAVAERAGGGPADPARGGVVVVGTQRLPVITSARACPYPGWPIRNPTVASQSRNSRMEDGGVTLHYVVAVPESARKAPGARAAAPASLNRPLLMFSQYPHPPSHVRMRRRKLKVSTWESLGQNQGVRAILSFGPVAG